MATTPKAWEKHRTAVALAKAHCANWVEGGLVAGRRVKPHCILGYVHNPDRKPSVPLWHVPCGGGAHAYVSAKCPHWYGGWCKHHGLPEDVEARKECPLDDWGWTADRCDWFELNLLLQAPKAVVTDYAFRTTPTPPSAVATHGDCVLGHEQPVRCPYFERCLLPAAPEAVARNYFEQFPHADAAGRRLDELHGELSGRECPRCGAPLPKRRRLCDACRAAARRARDRQKKQKRRDGTAMSPI